VPWLDHMANARKQHLDDAAWGDCALPTIILEST
jgi:hypothetical protein